MIKLKRQMFYLHYIFDARQTFSELQEKITCLEIFQEKN